MPSPELAPPAQELQLVLLAAFVVGKRDREPADVQILLVAAGSPTSSAVCPLVSPLQVACPPVGIVLVRLGVDLLCPLASSE